MVKKATGPRPVRTPPHISLKALREANGLKLDDVVERLNEHLKGRAKPFTRGALSAVELGHRGASTQILRGLEAVYGLKPGDMTTTYKPVERDAA